MSEIKFSCPFCGQHIQCDPAWSGHEINCPVCQQRLVVPGLVQSTPEVSTPSQQTRVQQPVQSAKYRNYEDVPWYRKSTLNHVFALSGLFCFPPLVWWVATMCLTGDIYKNCRDKGGGLKTWGRLSKVFSVIILVGQLCLYLLFHGSLVHGTARMKRGSSPAQAGELRGLAPEHGQPAAGGRYGRMQCENNLKLIWISFMGWEMDHQDQFPFNVSTKAGGTRELCARGSDGFDRNSAAHFRVLSKQLQQPKVLICPEDAAKRPAKDFSSIDVVNVSYLVRSGIHWGASPKEILAICPIHNLVLHNDGTVTARQ